MTSNTNRLDGAMMTDDTIDTVSKALRRAWQLGQTYWQQADSDSYKQQDKSDETQKKFEALVDETRALLSASKPDTPSADMQDERGACEVELEKSSWTRQAEARNAFRDGWRAGRAFSDRAASTSANVAPAATVQSGEPVAAYCPSQFGKQPHAFNHQKCGYCGIAAPQSSQPVEDGEAS